MDLIDEKSEKIILKTDWALPRTGLSKFFRHGEANIGLSTVRGVCLRIVTTEKYYTITKNALTYSSAVPQ